MFKNIFKSQQNIQSKKDISIRMCFNIHKKLAEFAIDIIKNELYGFSPEIMFIDYLEKEYKKDIALELIEEIDNNRGIIFKLIDETISLTVTYQAVKDSSLIMSWTLKNKEQIDKKLHKTIEVLTQNQNFICCYLYDYWDEYWQSATFESDYEIYGQPHKHLKRTENLWGEEVIDTSKNYGKLEVLRNVNIMAAPIMYFGQWYNDNICSFDKLKAKYEYEELPNKILKIKLSNSVFEINRNEQKKFLNLIEIEKLRQKFAVFSE